MLSYGLPLMVVPAAAGILDTRVFQHVLLAGPIVKLVLLLLVVFSVVSWAIIFLKFKLFKGIERHQAAFVKSFAEGKSLSVLFDMAEKAERTPMTEVFRTGYLELTRIQRGRGGEPAAVGARGGPFPMENIERAMRKSANEEASLMETYLPFLATTGSATLSTVAPGIAEALIATAAGLAAAIPSVMAYNYFLNRVRAIATRIDSFTIEFVNFLERNVDKV